MRDEITIIMATYNGELYIEEQINSIIHQTYDNWKLYIRDDGSTDATVEIVRKYMKEYPNIFVIEDEDNCKSAYKNFMALLGYVSGFSKYVMFCDQDDVWKENKIEITYHEMRAMEQKHGDVPICVFTGFELWKGDEGNSCPQEIDFAQKGSIEYLLTNNCALGCTIMLNQALVGKMTEWKYFLEGMHDWTAMQIARCCGQISYIPEATILYRQHCGNAVGANHNLFRYVRNRVANKKKAQIIEMYFKQAQELHRVCNASFLYADVKEKVEEFIEIFEYGKCKRCQKLIAGGFLQGSWIKKIGVLLFI